MSQARAASEPLLWLQLLGLGLLPLEALLVLLLLAGSDPGPLPGLERLLCWSIGALAPAVLLWRRPADVWSLLLVQTPARGRRDLQRRLSALQDNLALRIALAVGAALLLLLLWRLDAIAALATAQAPLPDAPRLVDLLLTAPLLALMLWQWQQALQAVWLLSRSPAAIAATPPLEAAALPQRRLSLGLPLLLLDPLAQESRPAAVAARPPAPAAPPAPQAPAAPEDLQPDVPQPDQPDFLPEESLPSPPPGPEPTLRETPEPAPGETPTAATEVVSDDAIEPEPEPAEPAPEPTEPEPETEPIKPEPTEPEAPEPVRPETEGPEPGAGPAGEPSVAGLPVAVEPEQGAEQNDGPGLDQPVG